MNEQLQQSLAVILNKAIAGVEAGAAFLGAQLPDVIQQLLVWKLVVSSFTALAGLLFVLPIVLLALHIRRGPTLEYKGDPQGATFRERDDRYKSTVFWSTSGELEDVPTVPAIIFGTVTAAGGALVFVVNASTALQIWLAPKIFLIEYAANLAKGG